MIDNRAEIREQILAQLAAMDDEYRELRAAGKRLTEVEWVRHSLMRAYEPLVDAGMPLGARERSEDMERRIREYRAGEGEA